MRPAYRRLGVARALATRVIAVALPLGRPIVLYTQTAAGSAFWETLGIVQIERENATHMLVVGS